MTGCHGSARVSWPVMIARMRKPVGLLAAALALGVFISLLKGTGGGARLQAGNISAPWLAIAFVAGALYKRPSRAAGAGLAATLAALVGFYAQQSPLADLGRGSLRFLGNPPQMYRFIVTPHLIIFVGAVVTGLVFGAFGSAWAGRRSRRAAAAIALCFVLEPFAWVAFGAAVGRRVFAPTWWLWISEIAVGLIALSAVLRRSPAD
jgi:hypothetical protein